MNLAMEVRPSSTSSGAGSLQKARSSRRLSLPDYSSLIIPIKPKPEKKAVESPSKRAPYEFEKVRCHPVDTAEDKAIQFQFKPKREYLPSQRRRRSLANVNETKFRFGASAHQRLVRRSLPMDLAPARRFQDSALTPFECQRKKHDKEEGALYSATRATERAAQAWKRKTIRIGDVVNDNANATEEDEQPIKEEEKQPVDKPQRRESLMALLEKDANRHNASLKLGSSRDDDNVGSKNPTLQDEDSPVEKEANNNNESGYKLPYQINPQAVKEKQLREVFQKQNAEKKRRSLAQKKQQNIQAVNANKHKQTEAVSLDAAVIKTRPQEEVEPQPKQKSLKREEQLQMLRAALKEAAATKEPALRTLVTLGSTKRPSMPNVYAATKLNLRPSSKSKKDSSRNEDPLRASSSHGQKKTKANRRASMPNLSSEEKGVVIYDWALAAKKQKEKENNNNSSKQERGQWKYIKSDKNAVRRAPEERIQPLQPSNEFTNAHCLPKLEALLPLVEPKLRD